MKIVLAAAGMGNVMFQYAFKCALEKRFGESCAFVVCKDMMQHNGYELERCFNIDKNSTLSSMEKCRTLAFEFMRNTFHVPFRLLFLGSKVQRMDGWNWNPLLMETDAKGGVYIGSWQSEKCFCPVKNEIRDIFKFNLSALNDNTISTAKKIQACESVSLHIRRGDYLSPEFGSPVKPCVCLSIDER